MIGACWATLPASPSVVIPLRGTMNRLYVVEGGYTSTGAAADSRLAIRPSQMPAFLAELGRRVEELASGTSHDHSDESEAFDELAAGQRLERFLDVLAHDIAEAGDKAVVVVGEHLGRGRGRRRHSHEPDARFAWQVAKVRCDRPRRNRRNGFAWLR